MALWGDVRLLMDVVGRIFFIEVMKRLGRILQVVVNAIEIDAGIGIQPRYSCQLWSVPADTFSIAPFELEPELHAGANEQSGN